MNLASKSVVKYLLKKYQVRPSKRLGQNFLIDNSVIRKVIRAANLQKDDVVLEIGPGIGNLTYKLAEKVKRVIAVEKDPKMCGVLWEILKELKNITIIRGDILKISLSRYKIQDTRYKVVANLPFYITAPVIRKFLESPYPPKEMILVVQKEVAQRICAKPPRLSLLAVSVQFYAKPQIIFHISKRSFSPQPEVDATIIKITPINSFRELVDADAFFRIVKAGFSQPRKQLVNNLSKGLAPSSPNGLKLDKEQVRAWLLRGGIQYSQRAEALTIGNWVELTKSCKLLNC
jgi:16S rRNA (adenine1518-N6/adenine1519-N6)-dimethyltransferase